MKLVLDTGILISALITKNTPPDFLYQAWRKGKFELITSQAQLQELVRVTKYKKLQRFITPEETHRLITTIHYCAEIVSDIPDVSYSPDADDNKIIATAIIGHADLIITGDKRDLLSLKEVEGIQIISPRQAIIRIEIDT